MGLQAIIGQLLILGCSFWGSWSAFRSMLTTRFGLLANLMAVRPLLCPMLLRCGSWRF